MIKVANLSKMYSNGGNFVKIQIKKSSVPCFVKKPSNPQCETKNLTLLLFLPRIILIFWINVILKACFLAAQLEEFYQSFQLKGKRMSNRLEVSFNFNDDAHPDTEEEKFRQLLRETREISRLAMQLDPEESREAIEQAFAEAENDDSDAVGDDIQFVSYIEDDYEDDYKDIFQYHQPRKYHENLEEEKLDLDEILDEGSINWSRKIPHLEAEHFDEFDFSEDGEDGFIDDDYLQAPASEAILDDQYFPGLMDDVINKKVDYYKIVQQLDDAETADHQTSLIEAFDMRVEHEIDALKDKLNLVMESLDDVDKKGRSPAKVVEDLAAKS